MRRNSRPHSYDTVYIEAPQIPDIRRLIAVPLKTIYINRMCNDSNIDCIFMDVGDLFSFCYLYKLTLP